MSIAQLFRRGLFEAIASQIIVNGEFRDRGFSAVQRAEPAGRLKRDHGSLLCGLTDDHIKRFQLPEVSLDTFL